MIENYEVPFRRYRSDHGGGLLVYFKSGLLFTRRYDLENDHDEIIWSQINLPSCKVLLCTMYRPPGHASIDFWKRLEFALARARDESPFIILNGVWNIDFLEALPPYLNYVFQLFNLSKLINVINEPTRVTSTTESAIDPIIISDALTSIESGVVELDLSDHFATYIVLNIKSPLPKKFLREIWSYKNADFNAFKTEVFNTDWSSLLNSEDINVCVQIFNNVITDLCKKYVPRKTVTVGPDDRPWFNSDIRREICLRDRLRNIYRRTKRLCDHLKFKNQRNKANNLIKVLKENYLISINDSLDFCKSSNPRQYWHIIHNLIRDSKPSQNISLIVNGDYVAVSSEEKS